MGAIHFLVSLVILNFSGTKNYGVEYPSLNAGISQLTGFTHYSRQQGYIQSGAFINQTMNFSIGTLFPVWASRSDDRNASFYLHYSPSLQSFQSNGYILSHQSWSCSFSLNAYDALSEYKNIDVLMTGGILFGKNYLDISDQQGAGKYSNVFFDLYVQASLRFCVFKKLALNFFGRYNLDLSRPTYRHVSGESYYVSHFKYTGVEYGLEIGLIF